MSDVWAVVELMGHVKHAGRLTEEEKFGGKLGRIDQPRGDAWVTHYFGAQSVYRITICDEQTARAVAEANPVRPVQAYELASALNVPARLSHTDADDYDDREPGDEDDPDEDVPY